MLEYLQVLFYADDIVLLAGSTQELQPILNIVAIEGTALGLRFNAKKWATMLCHPTEGTESERQPLLLQGDRIQWSTSYKYHGVTLTNGPNYSAAYEENLRA